MKLLKAGIEFPKELLKNIKEEDGIYHCEKHDVWSTSEFCLQCEIEKGNVTFTNQS